MLFRSGIDPKDRIFFVTNFNQNENMRYLDASFTWRDFRPWINKANTIKLQTSKMLISFQNYLLALNIYEDEGDRKSVV